MEKQPLNLVERVIASLGIVKALLRKAVGENSDRSGLQVLQRVLEHGELQKQDATKYGVKVWSSGTD